MTLFNSTSHCKNCSAFEKSVFHKLSPTYLDELFENKEQMNCLKGQKFNVQNEPALDVYCMASGSAKITRHAAKNNTQSIVRIAAKGDLLGYRCIFSEDQFRATASALENSNVCKISKSFMFKLIEENTEFSKEILKRMGQEIAHAENHHHSFCNKNVRERTAEALLLLKNKASTQISQGWRIDIKLTRNELASWIGTASETLIRCLSDFKQEGVIVELDDCMVITNPQALKAISQT